MDETFTIQDALQTVLNDMLRNAAGLVPRLITAILVIGVGFLFAKVAEIVLRTSLERIKLDSLLDKLGILSTLRRAGIESVARTLSKIVFTLAVLIFMESATRQVGLTQVADGIVAIFRFMPNLISAFLIFLLGSSFAQFVGGAVAAYARESGLSYARSLSSIVSGVIVMVVVVMALAQLKVDTRIVNNLIVVVFSGFALAFALTFGLGTRDTTRNIVAGFYARRLFRSGETVEMSGETGVLQTISAVQTVLDFEGRMMAIPNTVFLDQVVRRTAGAPESEPWE